MFGVYYACLDMGCSSYDITECASPLYIGIAHVTWHLPCIFVNSGFHFHCNIILGGFQDIEASQSSPTACLISCSCLCA